MSERTAKMDASTQLEYATVEVPHGPEHEEDAHICSGVYDRTRGIRYFDSLNETTFRVDMPRLAHATAST